MNDREEYCISGLLGETRRVAIFSPCRLYRYRLEIRWRRDGRALNFLMLNPSTADHVKNDPTVERCERRAAMMGFPAVIVTNLFALRATDPREMKAHRSPVGGDENDCQIVQAYAESEMTIAAWGSHGGHLGRSEQVRKSVLGSMPLQCLGVTADGEPRHPLYVGYDVQPRSYAQVLGGFQQIQETLGGLVENRPSRAITFEEE